MKILYIIPPPLFEDSNPWAHNFRFTSLAADYLLSSFVRNSDEVDFYDFDVMNQKRKVTNDDVLEYVKRKKYNAVLVSFTCRTNSYEWLYEANPSEYELARRQDRIDEMLLILKDIKDIIGDKPLIIGGDLIKKCDLKDYMDVLVTSKISSYELFSIVTKKEYWSDWVHCNDESYKKIKESNENVDNAYYGIHYDKHEKYPETLGLLKCKNIDDYQFSFDEILKQFGVNIPEILPDHFITYYGDQYIKQACFKLQCSCPGQCNFCRIGAARPQPAMDIDLFKDSIRRYIDLGFNSFFFINPSFNVSRKYSEKICNWIINENLDILWSDSMRFHGTDLDFYKMLYESGCRYLCFGAEQTDDNALKKINKKITVDKIKKSLWECHDAGIWTHLNLIFGLPNETEDEIINTINFLTENKEAIDTISVNKFKLYRNSPYWLNPEKHNIELIEGEGIDLYSLISIDNYIEKRFETAENTNYYKEKIFVAAFFTLRKKGLSIQTINQHLIFTLYKLFNEKKEVKKIINDITNKGVVNS